MTHKVLFYSSAVLFVLSLFFLVWALSSSSLSFTECVGEISLFAEKHRCRVPLIADYSFKMSLILCLSSLWLGIRVRRGQQNGKKSAPLLEERHNHADL